MFRFTSRPAADEPPLKTVALLLSIFIVACAAWVYMGAMYWGVFTLIILLLSLSSYFIKTEYVIDENGLQVKGILIKKRKWSDFKRVIKAEKGLFLSAFLNKSALDAFRGQYLPLKNNKEEIFEFILQKIEETK